VLQKRDGDGWDDLHELDDRVHSRPVDYEVYHHYTSTHPHSPFTGRLVVMRLAEGRFRRLLGRELTETRPDGTAETRTVAPHELREVLKSLDVVLTAEELEGLLRVY
jgi:N-hydroxyarylamine O-acetyltransferase